MREYRWGEITELKKRDKSLSLATTHYQPLCMDLLSNSEEVGFRLIKYLQYLSVLDIFLDR